VLNCPHPAFLFANRIQRKVELLGPGSPRMAREDHVVSRRKRSPNARLHAQSDDVEHVPAVSHSSDKLEHVTLGELLGLPSGDADHCLDGGDTGDLWHVLPAIVPAYHHIITTSPGQASLSFPGKLWMMRNVRVSSSIVLSGNVAGPGERHASARAEMVSPIRVHLPKPPNQLSHRSRAPVRHRQLSSKASVPSGSIPEGGRSLRGSLKGSAQHGRRVLLLVNGRSKEETAKLFQKFLAAEPSPFLSIVPPQ
jgi:hypothetical protein